MGYMLRREVRKSIRPGTLTSAERVLLLEIAEECGEQTREGWPGSERLAMLTDLSEGSIPNLLARIGEKWGEIRVEIGKDSKGRPIYARKGHRTILRIPPLARLDDDPTSRSDDGPALPEEDWTTVQPKVRRSSNVPAKRLDDGPPKVGPRSTPSPSFPSRENPHLSSQGKIERDEKDSQIQGQANRPTPQRLLEALGATPTEADNVVTWLTTERLTPEQRPRGNGWWRHANANGDLADYLHDWRTRPTPKVDPLRQNPNPFRQHTYQPVSDRDDSCRTCGLPAGNGRHIAQPTSRPLAGKTPPGRHQPYMEDDPDDPNRYEGSF